LLQRLYKDFKNKAFQNKKGKFKKQTYIEIVENSCWISHLMSHCWIIDADVEVVNQIKPNLSQI